MMLAGIVLTISFILTALTLAQVSSLEREAAGDGPSPIIGEWRFLHDRLGSNLATAIGPDTTDQSLLETILPTVQATFRSIESEKGYDLTIRAADGATFAATGNEASLIDGANYAAFSWDGEVEFDHDISQDPEDLDNNDGILWEQPCPDDSAPAAGCITGVYVYVRMTDGTSTLEESILFAVNRE